MKLSTRTRYGVRAILELAENAGKGPLQLRIIAQRQDISAKYLEQLMAVLKSAGFVRSVRGAKGGYVLARPADRIHLNEVFHCLEGSLTTSECVEDERFCQRAAGCPFQTQRPSLYGRQPTGTPWGLHTHSRSGRYIQSP